MAYINSKYCIFNGDVNQDQFIDFSDLTLIDNDAYNYTSGYVLTDVNGDMYVDFTDLTIVDNNSYNYIGVAKPSVKSGFARPVHRQHFIEK
jgi:hypothetical protein